MLQYGSAVLKKQEKLRKLPIISESTTEDGDGWDDDDADWGSLEDSNSSKQNKNNEITKEEFDSWATDLLSNKVPDKSAVVKQGVQSLNLVSYLEVFKIFIGS